MLEAQRVLPYLRRPTWIMARRQTAAKGRRGRAWVNPEGNFAATLIMRPYGTPAQAALRSFFAAGALFETLAMQVDRSRLAFKWPNDVLMDGGKVAGILLESAGTATGVDWLAIGIGVNLKNVPVGIRDAAFPPVALDGSVDAEDFLEILAGHMATEEALYARLGFEPIRSKLLRHAARLGEVITARTPKHDLTGVFETIDDDGNLILKTSDGVVSIAAADVYF